METKKIKVVKYIDGVTTNELTDLFNHLDESRNYVKELLDDCQVPYNSAIYRLILSRLKNCLLDMEHLELFQIKEYIEK